MRARSVRSRRRLLLPLAVLAGLAALLVLAPGAMADALSPESGPSEQANRIDRLYWVAFVTGVVVFVGVNGVLLYSLIRFKARKGRVAAQIHGNTNLEIGWTVGAALILLILTVATFLELNGIRSPERSGPGGLAAARGTQFASVDQPQPPGGKKLNIAVDGLQFLWRYTYPDGDRNPLNNVFSYEEMVVPVNTTVTLDIESQDVAHAWWIPKLGGKMDALPGYTNHTWFKATEEGVYTGNCTELCGRGHANMTGRVRVVSVPEYEAWLDRQRRDIVAAKRLAAEQRERFEPRSEEGGGEVP